MSVELQKSNTFNDPEPGGNYRKYMYWNGDSGG